MAKTRLTPLGILRFLGRLRPRVRPHIRTLGGAVVLLVLSTGVGLVFPLVVRELLDAAFLEGSGELLNRVAVGLLVLFAAQAFINFGQSYLTASVSERVVAGIRRDLFQRLVRQPPGYFALRRVGALSSRIASDASLLQDLLRFGLPELARQGMFLVGALALVTATNPRLTLVTLTAIPIAAGVGWWFGRRVRHMSTGIQDRLAAAVAHAEQVFTQIRTVQAFRREGWESDRFGDEIDAVQAEGLRRAVARASLTGTVTFAAFGAIVMVLWEGGRLVLAGSLSPGTLVAFLLYAVTISGAITSLAGFYGNLNEAAGAARRIFEILDEPRGLDDPENPLSLPRPLRGVVRYEDVHFRYGPELPWVLSGVDFEVGAGETVALVGSSGAGKSTTAALLPRFFDVERGVVAVDGVDVRRLALDDLRGAIGIVPQEPMLFAGTLRENLLYGNPQATAEEMHEAAEAAHADVFIRELPEGFDQMVGERGVTLSAGQRQRVAIARVMLARPRILILDEASSSLDAESERLVQDALEHLMRDRTTLVIAHRLSTVIRADRIVVLDQGRIVDAGRHPELLERSDVYRRLYQRQFEDALATTAATGTARQSPPD
jgi:subfamily B ATP-binding cassette protein MsbA